MGAGTGTVAEALAERVSPHGRVVATDTDTRFLEPLGERACSGCSAADVTAGLPDRPFDLIHARLLLEHLPQRQDVLRSMADAAAPGGWVLVEDFDWSTALMVDPPTPLLSRVADACRGFMSSRGYDPEFGRRLPRALAAVGLVDIGTHAQAMPVYADPQRGVPQWELLVAQLGPALLAARAAGASRTRCLHPALPRRHHGLLRARHGELLGPAALVRAAGECQPGAGRQQPCEQWRPNT